MDTEQIGKTSSFIGAGRENKDEKIDIEAGIVMKKKIGDRIEAGEAIAYIHTNRENRIDEAINKIQEAVSITNTYDGKYKTILNIINL